MASIYRKPNGIKGVQFTDPFAPNRRPKISLGKVSKSKATLVKNKVERILAAKRTGDAIDNNTAEWIAQLPPDMRSKLVGAGLIAATERSRSEKLDTFVAGYIANREDAAPNTVRNWNNSRKKLIEFFGADHWLHEINAGGADDWRQWLVNAKYSDATISKAVKHAKQFFAAAERKGLVESNPFHHLKAGGEENENRKAFIDQETIDRVINHTPDTQWKTIISLARYGGLRCPSEVLGLRWSDIDWKESIMTVTSPKTKRNGKAHRLVPIFPEVRPHLERAREQADEGAVHVITRFRSSNSNLRTQFMRLLSRAGIEPWERLFQNLRASRETELTARGYQLHVVCAWLGNTERVASKHYLQVTKQDFERAIKEGAKSGAFEADWVQNRVQHESTENGTDFEKLQETPENTGVFEDDAAQCVTVPEDIAPPRGVEPLFSD